MRNAAQYAQRLHKVLAPLARAARPSDASTAAQDPLYHLAVGVLGCHDGRAAGQKALERIFRKVLDWNELRVSTPDELVNLVGGSIRRPAELCRNLCDVLNAVFRRENTMSLRRLAEGKVKDARRYLESLSGINAYATASVLAIGLGAHAIPVSDRLLDTLRRMNLVDPQATRAEVQAFLERNIKAGDLRSCCAALDHLEAQRVERGAGASGSKSSRGAAADASGAKRATSGRTSRMRASRTGGAARDGAVRARKLRPAAEPAGARKSRVGKASRRDSTAAGRKRKKRHTASRTSSGTARRRTGK